jgi:hypothetical protein
MQLAQTAKGLQYSQEKKSDHREPSVPATLTNTCPTFSQLSEGTTPLGFRHDLCLDNLVASLRLRKGAGPSSNQ